MNGKSDFTDSKVTKIYCFTKNLKKNFDDLTIDTT